MPLDYDKIINWSEPPVTQSYSARDTILYALGVGVSVEPMADDDLKYVYEGAGFAPLPTLPVVLGQGRFWMATPEAGLDWKRILHGEQMLEIHAPIPAEGRVISQEKVDAIYDKGPAKGALCYSSRTIVDAGSGTLLATVRSCSILRGDGGFDGTSEGAPRPHPLPDRAPDAVIDLPTRTDQAMLYRLSGDTNPLHIDPQVARAAGFDKPILHGLCGYGLAGRAVTRALCGNDPSRLTALDARFASPVFPGETLRFEIWREREGHGAFLARSVERDTIVLNNGRVTYAAGRT